MPGTPWTPIIVGGTDHGDEPLPPPEPKAPAAVVQPGVIAFIPPPANQNGPEKKAPNGMTGVVMVTEEELATYASMLDTDVAERTTWEYGPLTDF